MSTRSAIGTTDGTTFSAVYCHFDGYPTGIVPDLARIITRDGADALPILLGEAQTARGGKTTSWESLVSEMPAPDTQLPYPEHFDYLDKVPAEERDRGISYLYSHLAGHRGSEDEARDCIVEGYGTVLTKRPDIRFSGTLPNADTGWCEWAYLFDQNLTLHVFECTGTLVERAQFTTADLAALAEGDTSMRERLGRVECGEDWSRCSHYAWVHDDTVPDESRYLSMSQWLGVDPIPYDRAIAAHISPEYGKTKAKRVEFSGGGHLSGNLWCMSTKDGEFVPVYTVDKHGSGERHLLSGVHLVYPQTKVEVTK